MIISLSAVRYDNRNVLTSDKVSDSICFLAPEFIPIVTIWLRNSYRRVAVTFLYIGNQFAGYRNLMLRILTQ